MPKRTNPFQRLICYIHEQVEGTDSRVMESAFLPELNLKKRIKREVDVLIEKEINGQTHRIAIECRDRADKDDIQWVDSLIGKYSNLDVDKVIAVSNTGFTKSALQKAIAHRIELRTLKDAYDIDFKNEFTKLSILKIEWQFTTKVTSIIFEPTLSRKLNSEDIVYLDNKTKFALGDYIRETINVYERENLRKDVNENAMVLYKTKADLNNLFVLTCDKKINRGYIKAEKRERHYIRSLTIQVVGKPNVKDKGVRRRLYDKALITEGIFNDTSSDNVYTVRVAQLSGKREGGFFISVRKKKNRKLKCNHRHSNIDFS